MTSSMTQQTLAGEERLPGGYPLPAEADGHIVRPALLAEPTRNLRPEYMRELNVLIVLEAFRRRGVMSRAAVAKHTHISAPTVSKIVQRLIDARLLLEQGAGVSTGGKRPTILRFNADYGRVLGIDLGGSHLRLAVADLDGRIIDQSWDRTDAGAGPAGIADQIAEAGRILLRATSTENLLAVSLATPGVVDVDRGVVVAARNLRGWRDVPIREMLAQRFSVPATVENDVNAAAIGERWRGSGCGHDTLVFISIGTGIGAGIIIGGQIHRGSHFAAGEVNMLPSGVLDGDGMSIGLEDVVSGPAIVRRAEAAGVRSPDGIPLTTESVFKLAQVGDIAARSVVQDTVRAMARAVASLASAVDPTVVVFGGGVSRQGQGLIDAIERETTGMLRLRTAIVLSDLGVDAQLHGAVFAGLRLADLSLVDLARTAGV